MAYQFKILASENYDGDSFDLTLDLGFHLVTHQKCRLYGVDTPELRGGTEDSKAAARLARGFAREFVHAGLEAGAVLEFHSKGYQGKFGRPLGDILVDGVSLVQALISRNYGVPYSGQSKAEVQPLHEANFTVLRERGEI